MHIDFKYDAFKSPVRILVTGVSFYELSKTFVGATASKIDRYQVTFPMDDIITRRLIQKYPDAQVAPEVENWLEEEYRFNKEQVVLKAKTSLGVDGDNAEWAFQDVDVEFMSRCRRSINGNDMGTGKTIESIKLADKVNAQTILIVCSKSKMSDWYDEITKWSDGECLIIRGTTLMKQRRLNSPSRWKIVSYGALRKQLTNALLFTTYWDCVFVDEAHRLRNLNSQQGRGMKNIRTKYLSLLTGTAIYNKLTNLFSLLHLCDPNRWGSFIAFQERFCVLSEGYGGHSSIVGVKNEKVLQYFLAPIMLDRKKADVLPWLPKKIMKTMWLRLEGTHARIYKTMEKESMITNDKEELVVAPTALAELLRLRQICASPMLIGIQEEGVKIDAIKDIVDDAHESNQKVVILSSFRPFVEHIATVLNNACVNKPCAVTYTGEMSDNACEASKRRFKDDPSCTVFCATIQKAGEGLNLQHASVLIIADPPLTRGERSQAIERLDRAGQMVNPFIIQLVCKDTVEEHVYNCLEEKEEVNDSVMVMNNILARIRK